MSQKFLKSDEVDLKKFMGRVLTLLGEITQQIHNQSQFLEKAFHVPSEYPEEDSDRSGVEYDQEEDNDL